MRRATTPEPGSSAVNAAAIPSPTTAVWHLGPVPIRAYALCILGARVYHLATSPQDYFGPGGDPVRAFAVWEGGLRIWGAVAGGAIGAYIAACR